MNRHEAHHGFQSFPRTDHELAEAQWTMVLTLQATANVFLESLYCAAIEAWALTPRWRWLARRRLLREAEVFQAIYIALADYARVQDKL